MPTKQEELRARRRNNLAQLEQKVFAMHPAVKDLPFSNEPAVRQMQMAVMYLKLRRNRITPESTPARLDTASRSVLDNTDPDLRVFTKVPERYRADLLADLASDDMEEASEVVDRARVLSGLSVNAVPPEQDPFALRVNRWDRMMFSLHAGLDLSDEANRRITNPAALEALNTLEAMPIELPENGLDEKAAKALLYAVYYTPENLARIGRRAQDPTGSRSTTIIQARGITNPTTDDYIYDGKVFLFDNLLSSGLSRHNHGAPLYESPAIRAQAIDMIRRGDPREMAQLMSDSFHRMLWEAKNNAKLDGPAYSSYILSTRLFEALNREPLVQYARISDDDRKAVEFLHARAALHKRQKQLIPELNAYVADAALYGADLSPAQDPVFQDKLAELQAIELYFATESKQREANSKMNEYRGLSYTQHTEHLMPAEYNLANDPKGYLGHLKDVVKASPEQANYQKRLNNWNSALKEISRQESVIREIDNRLSHIMVPEMEKLVMPLEINRCMERLSIYLTAPEKNPDGLESINRTKEHVAAAKHLIAELPKLPCMKGDFVTEAASAEDLNRLIDAYSHFADQLPELRFEYKDNTKNGTAATIQPVTYLQSALVNEIQNLKGYAAARDSEKAYLDSAMTRMDQKAASFEQQQVAPSHDDLLVCGRPTEEYCKAVLDDVLAGDELHDAFRRQPDALTKALRDIRDARASDNMVDALDLYSGAMDRLETLKNQIDEKMLSDDSPALLKQVAALSKLMSAVEMVQNAPETTPRAADCQSVYDSAAENRAVIDRDMEHISPNTNMYRLAQRAQRALDNIQKAIGAEAFGEKKEGLAALAASDDLAAISVYQAMKAVAADPTKQKKLAAFERTNLDKAIKEANGASKFKSFRKSLTLDTLGASLRRHQGLLAASMGEKFVSQPKAGSPAVKTKTVQKTGPAK